MSDDVDVDLLQADIDLALAAGALLQGRQEAVGMGGPGDTAPMNEILSHSVFGDLGLSTDCLLRVCVARVTQFTRPGFAQFDLELQKVLGEAWVDGVMFAHAVHLVRDRDARETT